MRSTAIAVALCGLAACFVGGTLRAQTLQNSDLRPLLERLDRLERDMNLLQRQVYRGTSPNGAPVALSPPDSTSAVNYEVRFSQIDDQMRTITGQIEELNYAIDQMKHRLETLSNDVDQRLTALEHGSAGAGASNVAAGSAAPPPRGAGANPTQPASQSGVLGQLPSKDEQTAAAAAPAAPGAGASPQEQYNYAFGLLRQANYPAAEQALRSFIQRYPNDQLAGNAQYWLGETFYVRKDYNSAAAVFAEGYQKYPKGGKAADNLLKLGMSLGNLGQKADACRAYSRLDRDFPNSVAKDRAAEEKKKLGC